MTLPVKLGFGTLTLGTLSGLTYGTISYFQASTAIEELIEKEYIHILLDSSQGRDEQYWTENWASYIKENTGKDNDLFGLEGWKKDGLADLKEELKKKCNILKTSKVYGSSDKLYKNVTDYCSRFVTVKEDAEKNGSIILDTTQVASSGQNLWQSKTSTETELLKRLEISESQPTAENIRAGCEKAKDKSKKENNYEKIYQAYLKVCTNPKT